jgi:hypothetical protein
LSPQPPPPSSSFLDKNYLNTDSAYYVKLVEYNSKISQRRHANYRLMNSISTQFIGMFLTHLHIVHYLSLSKVRVKLRFSPCCFTYHKRIILKSCIFFGYPLACII